MIEEIGEKEIKHGIKSYVYKIQLTQSHVFMRIDKSNFMNDERYVVIVDSAKFYKAWEGKEIEQCVITDEYEQERYNASIEGFAEGISNPVPIAEVVYNKEFSFTSGITRTKYLIINGAKCIPLEFGKESAMKICQNIPDVLYSKKVENVYNLLKLE
jgi:hypothetical protein